MMAKVVFEHVSKRFGSVTAVNDMNLTINDQEFIVIVGPSGCGKTTALRMVAGLEAITEGKIFIDDRLVNNLPPKDRDIAMVFQNYALYPHLTVYGNMAFGLKLRHVKRADIDAKVHEVAKTLQIEHLLERRPRELSGGQRQRVALGRAIVRQPKVFLMDEPLSNLDAKLRVEMRASLAQLHQQLGVTTIYVTHDQVEAMTMGHRIVVMKDGQIQQIDTPVALYNNPVSKFVADFIGSPAMNFIKGRVQGGHIKGDLFDVKPDNVLLQGLTPYEGREVYLGIRPENLGLKGRTDIPEGDNLIRARVRLVEPIGAETIIIGTVGEDNLVARVDAEAAVRADDEVILLAKPNKVHAFDVQDEHNIRYAKAA
jgi:multiple sugar transport system ATP-binding protein